MAIVQIDPADWQNASMLQIDSDAPHTQGALLEIITWANQHGFELTPDLWLKQITTEEKRLFRGFCYSAAYVEKVGWATICEK